MSISAGRDGSPRESRHRDHRAAPATSFGTIALAVVLACPLMTVACGDRSLPLPLPGRDSLAPEPDTPQQIEAALRELNGWEDQTRRATDFTALPPFERRSGANPHAIVALDGSGSRAVGVLRGTDQLVLLDGTGKVLSRVAAPASPVDLAVDADRIYVVGESTSMVAEFAVDGGELVQRSSFDSGLLVPRAIAAGDGRVFVADDVSGDVVMFEPAAARRTVLGTGHGPLDLALTANHLVAVFSLDHSIRTWKISDGNPQPMTAEVKHDGPLWSAIAIELDGELLVAATGIEDRPLDRSNDGSFGYIDTFAFIYRIREGGSQRLASINISEHGLVTSKWLELEIEPAVRLRLGSYGGDRELTLQWSDRSFAGTPQATTRPLPPGTTSRARLGKGAILANPLLDGWLIDDGAAFTLQREAGANDKRSIESKVGELLFFTSLMAPWSESTEMRSRFTCEACHVEGYGDGRTHFTGRDDVIATSRPLRGLFNNRPHFTRALDETTTEMVNNEFGVANKLNGRSPWFEIRAAEFPWLANVEGVPATMSPVYLRKALMLFLRDFTHRANPVVRQRTAFSEAESRGAALFRDQCEVCHSARTVADDKGTAVAFEKWESHLFTANSAIVWGRSGYEKTGVKPYVHPKGARPPTLRRLYKKWPYFTNGSAKTLSAVLADVRIAGATETDNGFDHAGGAGRALTTDERSALLAFLTLL